MKVPANFIGGQYHLLSDLGGSSGKEEEEKDEEEREVLLSDCGGSGFFSEARGRLLCVCWDFSSRWRSQNSIVHSPRILAETKQN